MYVVAPCGEIVLAGRAFPSYAIDIDTPFGPLAELNPRKPVKSNDDVRFALVTVCGTA